MLCIRSGKAFARGLVRAALIFAAACGCLTLSGCGRKAEPAVQVLLDGQEWDGAPVSPDAEDDLRVYVTLDGAALIDLPFSETHTVTVIQPEVGENTVELTGDSVVMAHADCENQDCVDMGAVTRDNLELRVMGGFIVCLPHRLSVEVRSP